MSDPYEKVKGGRLSFKGGSLATRSNSKSIDKKKKKKKKKTDESEPSISLDAAALNEMEEIEAAAAAAAADGDEDAKEGGGGAQVVYTIDAAKRMKYDQLFPVEAKKFGYDPKSTSKSVEDALHDRIKKKADRYCK